jgi:hypothetical protein
MQPKAPRNRLVLLGFVLGLFGVFATSPARAEIGSNCSVVVMSEAATASGVVAILGSLDGSDSMLTGVGIDLSDDFGVALEDSVELLPVDLEQRAYRMDRSGIEPKASSKQASIGHANISPPLLV